MNAREKKGEFFAVPHYLTRRVLGNLRAPTGRSGAIAPTPRPSLRFASPRKPNSPSAARWANWASKKDPAGQGIKSNFWGRDKARTMQRNQGYLRNDQFLAVNTVAGLTGKPNFNPFHIVGYWRNFCSKIWKSEVIGLQKQGNGV